MFGALLGLGGSLFAGLGQANAMENFAHDIDKALDVRAHARRNGFSLKQVFGRKVKMPEFQFKPQDLLRYQQEIGNYASGEGADKANALASKINSNTLDDLEAAFDRQFGGNGSYARQRDAVAQNTEDMLAGKLSMSARRQLGRRAASAGASGIGPDAVNDQYAGYLGMATEDIVSRGAQQYQSLYAGYRQAMPLVTGFDAMNYTAANMGQGLQTAMAAAENNYSARVNKRLARAAPDPVASGLVQAEMQRASAVASANLQAASAEASAIGGGISGLGGLFSGGGGGGFGF